MASGLDYLTEQPAMPTAAAPAQGALGAAAPYVEPGYENFNANFMQNLRDQMQLAARDNPDLAGVRNLVGAVPYELKDVPVFSFAPDEYATGTPRFQPVPGKNYRLMDRGQLIGESSDPATIMELVKKADALSASMGKAGDWSFEKQLDDGGYAGIRGVEPPSFIEKFGDIIMPAAFAALSGGLLAKPLALAFGAKAGAGGALTGGLLGAGKTIGTGLAAGLGSTAGNLAIGKPLGQSLISGGISGLTAGALSGLGVDNALGNLGGVKGSTVGSTLADLGPEAITVLANKFPNIVPAVASGAGGALSNVLPSEGGAGAPGQYIPPTPEPGLDILANRFPTGSAIPTSGLSGAVSSAVSNLLTQPQPTTPQEPAPETTDDEIVVTGRPGAPIVTSALPFEPIVTGLAQTIPDLSVRPDVAPVEEQAPATTEAEIVVTGRPDAPIVTGALPFPEAIGMSLPLATIGSTLASVPPAPPPKTPLQKALTTGGRILTGLSLLGGLAGGGGRNTSGLGTGAAAIGTRASLDPVFGGQLPTASGLFATQGMAPRVMGDIDYERYGYGPARSFFENVPETPEQYRAALAANAPRPMVAGAGTVGVPNFMSNLFPSATGSAALQAVRRLAPGVPDAQIEAFLATPEGADFLAAIQEAETPQGAARGGAMSVKGRGKPSRDSYAVNGIGDGRSDEIPALLSDGEYVIDAETVAMLGDGSGKAGAKRLDDLRVKIRKHKGRNLAKGRFSDNAKAPEKYLSGGRT